MSVAGIKVSDVAKVDLRPSAVKRSYYSTQARVVKYYSNMRGFYEIDPCCTASSAPRLPPKASRTSAKKPKPKEKQQNQQPPKFSQDGKGEDHNQSRTTRKMISNP